jgi:hypothetical protein
MAQSGPMDITFNDFKILPTELKNLVLSKLPIREILKKGLVSNHTEVGSAVDELIKYYIDTKLFTDAFIFTYLTRIKSYDIIIEKKLFEMGHDFIKECNRLDETPKSEQKNINIFFDIKYKNGTDLVSYFRYQTHSPHVLACGEGAMRASDIKSIGCEIWGNLYKLMNDFKNVKLQSIELVETTYTENHTVYDMCDSHKGDFRVIKKYY